MAKRRTKQQKAAANERLMGRSEGNANKSKRSSEVGSLSYSPEQISLIKRDLLKTLIISATIFILLFGIYFYMR